MRGGDELPEPVFTAKGDAVGRELRCARMALRQDRMDRRHELRVGEAVGVGALAGDRQHVVDPALGRRIVVRVQTISAALP